jgi:hypothetical protein
MNNPNFFKAGQPPGKPKRQRHAKGFEPPKKVEDHWDLYHKGVYVTQPGRGLPAWLLPLLALVLILTLVFWAAPTMITRIRVFLSAGEDQNQEQVSLLYDENTWTVKKPVADVFEQDDLKASRISQALYNEPILVLSQDCTFGFVQVRLADGCEGYMQAKDLIDSRESIEPDLFSFKLVVADTTKRILSDASHGTLLVEVPMGAILFADYRGDGISRVILPGGSSGWIGDSGVIILPATGKIEPVVNGAKYFCSTALAFNQVTVLENGQSIYGISTPGIARLAGAVNGISLPRSLAGLAACGQPVLLDKDPDTGLYILNPIQAGDLVFLSDKSGQSPTPVDLAICISAGQVLYARPGQSAIRLIDLTQAEDLQKRIMLVRRLY